jgi:hypothetical protein
VAHREIGHLLGFLSSVDDIDQHLTTPGAVAPQTLDLFRFGQSSSTPSTTSQFTTNPRELRPGRGVGVRRSEPKTRCPRASATGDGRQASHWEDDTLTGQFVGITGPHFGHGASPSKVTAADLRALDLIRLAPWLCPSLPPTPRPAGAMLLAGRAMELVPEWPDAFLLNGLFVGAGLRDEALNSSL